MKESFNPDHLLGRRYSNDWTREQLEGYASSTTTAHGVTIPVNVEIEANQKILDFSSIEEILKKASKYAVVDCVCRTTLENCDAPKDVCLAFDEYADKTVENGERNPRYLTYEEALDTVKRAQEAGLVHMAYTNKNEDYPNSICGCCTCCCGILGAVMRFGVSLPFPLVTSDKIAEYVLAVGFVWIDAISTHGRKWMGRWFTDLNDASGAATAQQPAQPKQYK